jgi:glycosyltransferase involved in cell wall biosynthesis
MCSAFAELGHDIELFGVAASGKVDAKDVLTAYAVSKPVVLNLLRPGRFMYARLVARSLRIKANPPDLYFGRDPYQLLCAARAGVPVVYETHSAPKSIVRISSERMLFANRSFAGLVAINKGLRDYYASAFAEVSARILIAHDGADLRTTSRSQLARDGRLRVGYVGSLQRGRGIATVLELAKRWPNVCFDIVGGKPEEIEHWRAGLQARNVVFHGSKTQRELPQLYELFDICIAPYESRVYIQGGHDTASWMSPMKLFEYMSYGKPILASDMLAIREVLTDGRDCLLVAPADLDAWSDALRRLVESADLRRTLSEAALANLAAHYTWTARAQSILQTFGVRA